MDINKGKTLVSNKDNLTIAIEEISHLNPRHIILAFNNDVFVGTVVYFKERSRWRIQRSFNINSYGHEFVNLRELFDHWEFKSYTFKVYPAG